MKRLVFLACCQILLIAAEPVWKDKAIADWTEEDAQQILANSPWAKVIVAGIARRRTESELREGGEMGNLMEWVMTAWRTGRDRFQRRSAIRS